MPYKATPYQFMQNILEEIHSLPGFTLPNDPNNADNNKKILLEMAKSGKPKPSCKTPLGASLRNYISKVTTVYDAEFEKQIKAYNDWFIHPYVKLWEKQFASLKSFIKENGRYPSQYSSDYEEVKLYRWFYGQKCGKKGTSNCVVTPDRAKKLESLPGWKWFLDIENIWKENLRRWTEFTKIYGKRPVYNRQKTRNNKLELILSRWAERQKQIKRGTKKGHLSESQITALNETPGWVWETDLNDKWTLSYKEVCKFVMQSGKIPSNASYKTKDERVLGQWCRNQRAIKKGKRLGELTPDRISKLEAIPGWFWEK